MNVPVLDLGINRILEPAMSDEGRRALGQSAEVLRQAV